jgi:hypothetical protein
MGCNGCLEQTVNTVQISERQREYDEDEDYDDINWETASSSDDEEEDNDEEEEDNRETATTTYNEEYALARAPTEEEEEEDDWEPYDEENALARAPTGFNLAALLADETLEEGEVEETEEERAAALERIARGDRAMERLARNTEEFFRESEATESEATASEEERQAEFDLMVINLRLSRRTAEVLRERNDPERNTLAINAVDLQIARLERDTAEFFNETEESEAMASEATEEDDESSEEDEAEEPAEKKDLGKALVEPLFCVPCGFEFSECAICFDEIEMVNVTVTTCGHSFHSSCIFKALENSENCPMCRNQLIEMPTYEDDDEDDEGEENDDEEEGEEEEDDDDDDEEDPFKVSLEQLTAKMVNLGYTMADLLKFYVSNIKTTTSAERYSEPFFEKLEQDIDGVIDGTIPMSQRDTRSYAAVAKAPQVQAHAGAQAQAEV